MTIFLPVSLWYLNRSRARPWHFIPRVDVVVIRGSVLTPSPSSFNSFNSLKRFDDSTVVQLLPSQAQAAARVFVLGYLLVDGDECRRQCKFFCCKNAFMCTEKVNSCRNKIGRKISPWFCQDRIRYPYPGFVSVGSLEFRHPEDFLLLSSDDLLHKHVPPLNWLWYRISTSLDQQAHQFWTIFYRGQRSRDIFLERKIIQDFKETFALR